MSDQRIKIPRVSDRTVADVLCELAKQYGVAALNARAIGFNNIGLVQPSDEPTGEWKALLDADSYLLDMLSLSIGGLSISYFRGGHYEPEGKSPFFDEIVLNWSNNPSPTAVQKIEIVAFLNKRLRQFEPGRLVGEAVSPEQAQLAAIHESTLERLERLNEDLIRESTEFRSAIDAKFDEKVQRLEGEYQKKKEQLGTEFDARANALEAKELALAEKLNAIDDRDNTHVRREIRDRMLDDVKQRINQFGVSKTTEQKRRPVLIGIMSLLTAFMALLAWTGYEIAAMDKQYFSMLEAIRNISTWGPENIKTAGLSAEVVAKVSATDVDRTHLYWLWLRFGLFAFGLVGTILYYIKWQNRWAEQHATSEFHLQQFYIDVNRANWVIESCLEWRKETESAIPKELLGSIANGLFQNNQAEPERVIHPADELASALLGTASKLKLKVGDSELEFDKPKKIPNKPIKVGASNEA